MGAGLLVVAIVRDTRDALVRPLPSWSNEKSLNHSYRSVWDNLGVMTAWIRYEQLVRDPEMTMATVAAALGIDGPIRTSWGADEVPGTMLKLDRHALLRSGVLSSTRVGIWRRSGLTFSRETHKTARRLGYASQ